MMQSAGSISSRLTATAPSFAFKTGGILHVRSRNDNDFASRYPAIVQGLSKLPNETVIDGELVALDGNGRPSFNALQNSDARTPVQCYVFDVMVLSGRAVAGETLARFACVADFAAMQPRAGCLRSRRSADLAQPRSRAPNPGTAAC